MRVAILQSNYIPWKGYFDIMRNVDLFIFHDDLQYTKGDWRNRNRIKTPKGSEWITIPCGVNEKRLICEVELINNSWQLNHWKLIQSYYAKAPYFKWCSAFFEEIYIGHTWKNLSELNQHIIKEVSSKLLGLNTTFGDSRAYNLKLTKGGRVIELLKKACATTYLSGPAGKTYLDELNFANEGIELEWMNYDDYPTYPQLYPPFEHSVSIIDLLFNTGPNANFFMHQTQKTCKR